MATDARRREVYWARYDADGARVDGPPCQRRRRPARLPVDGSGRGLYPTGWTPCSARRWTAGCSPRRAGAARGRSRPLYLRRPDAAVPSPRKSVLLQPDGPPVGGPLAR